MSLEHLTGWKLLVERIKTCTNASHDGNLRCKGCIAEVRELKVRYGRTRTGSLIHTRIQRKI